MDWSPKLVVALVSMTAAAALVGCSSSPMTPPGQPQARGSVKGIDVTIAAEVPTTLRPGGAPMRFRVTLVNNTTTDLGPVGMVVSLGHCSCGSPGTQMMPAGTMRMLEPGTGAWMTVPYVREGTGMDFLGQTLVPPVVLQDGQTTTYELEVTLAAQQDFVVGKGESAINVTMTDGTTNTALGVSPTASLPVTVEP